MAKLRNTIGFVVLLLLLIATWIGREHLPKFNPYVPGVRHVHSVGEYSTTASKDGTVAFVRTGDRTAYSDQRIKIRKDRVLTPEEVFTDAITFPPITETRSAGVIIPPTAPMVFTEAISNGAIPLGWAVVPFTLVPKFFTPPAVGIDSTPHLFIPPGVPHEPFCTTACVFVPPVCVSNCTPIVVTPPGCVTDCGGTPPEPPPGCTLNCGSTPPTCSFNCNTPPPVCEGVCGPPVTATPEPETWALVLTGLIVLGIIAHKKGKNATP
jgi:hypothetical protein